MKFIRIKDTNGHDVWVNPESIAFIEPDSGFSVVTLFNEREIATETCGDELVRQIELLTAPVMVLQPQ